MDEFEIEVTDLREQKATTVTAGNHTDPVDLTASHSTARELLGKRLSRRQRLLRTLALVTTILLALALILATNPNMRTALNVLLHPNTTFANSTAPGSEQFDLVHIAPWGDLHIDGQTVPPMQVLQRFRAITLAPGIHTLDYSVPPFAPLHCTLTVPADPTSDTCPLTQTADDLYPVQNDSVRMLDLRSGFNNLSGQQLAALIKAAEAGLAAGSPTATVDWGEHYLTANGDIATNTSRPIQATLLYHLSTAPSQMLPGFEPFHCQTLCFYRPLLEPSPDTWGIPTEEWGVLAHVTLSWSYAIPHGPVVSGPVTPENDTIDVGVPLHITWQQGWRVTPLKYTQQGNGGLRANPLCVPVEEMISSALERIAFMGGSEFGPPLANGANGCLVQWRAWIGQNTTGADPNGYGPPNYLFYRFGVLLAANDQAHHTFPTLPLANTSEQSLASQLAAQS